MAGTNTAAGLPPHAKTMRSGDQRSPVGEVFSTIPPLQEAWPRVALTLLSAGQARVQSNVLPSSPPRMTQEWEALTTLRNDVEAFASQFPTIGFEEASMRYK